MNLPMLITTGTSLYVGTEIMKTKRTVLLLSLLAFNATTMAMTLVELQQADKVRIKTWIEPQENLIARQQLNLQIEISTDSWFSGGTKIGYFDVKDAIVLQREQFAVNSSRTDSDKKWAVQQWTLVVYPQRAGPVEIPAIAVDLSIAGEDQKSIQGRMMTEPFSLQVGSPDAMRDKQHWVATSVFEIEESYSQSLDGLHGGDALVRTIRLTAENLPAMMLPTIDVKDIPGIAIYQKPPELTDRVNRGNYLAERVEILTYVFEQAGQYELPELNYSWWNLQTLSAEVITLPAKELIIAGGAGQVERTDDLSSPDLKQKLQEMLPMLYRAVLVLAGLLLALWLLRRWVNLARSKNTGSENKISESSLLKEIKKACDANRHASALNGFYRWINDFGEGVDADTVREWLVESGDGELVDLYEQTMKAAYSKGKFEDAGGCEVFMRIIATIKNNKKPRHLDRWSVELNLN